MDFFSPAEAASRDALASMQTVRLKNTVEQAAKSPFYGKTFAQAGVSAGDLRTADDIVKLPFTDKDDLRSAYPHGLVAVDKAELVRLHASSGTTGAPVVV